MCLVEPWSRIPWVLEPPSLVGVLRIAAVAGQLIGSMLSKITQPSLLFYAYGSKTKRDDVNFLISFT